jgi:glutamate-1-semialdehyde 2,1-aminomutase
LGNFWLDTSAFTESGALEAVIRTFGTERLLYGSDFPISHQRGRCVAFGDSFLWLSADNVDFPATGRPVEPTLVAIEELRSLKLACFNMSVTDTQLEAIFHSNATAVFKLAA